MTSNIPTASKMSSNKIPSNKMSSKKPFCKVCYDTGKPESVYTSHWVRTLPGSNSSGVKITCPTLLATECRYCLKAGHTVKFCPTIEQRNKFLEKQSHILSTASEKGGCDLPNKRTNGNVGSIFAVLSDDYEDNNVAAEKNDEVSGVSWAKIAAKPAVKKVELETDVVPFSTPKTIPPSVIRRHTTITPAWSSTKKFTKSWADFSDSDSEEDDVDEVALGFYTI